jgi:hypothetical protein
MGGGCGELTETVLGWNFSLSCVCCAMIVLLPVRHVDEDE